MDDRNQQLEELARRLAALEDTDTEYNPYYGAMYEWEQVEELVAWARKLIEDSNTDMTATRTYKGFTFLYNPVPLARAIEDTLVDQGRGPELMHPNASPYWNHDHHDIRYVCQYCAEWFTTAVEFETHLREIEAVTA